MAEKFLYEKLDVLKESGNLKEVPPIIKQGISSRIILRDYQTDALAYFVTYFENKKMRNNKQVHTLFQMATGSGKTVIMAGLILYLYMRGYRKFLFFVNQTNILDKTIDNFINKSSSKYLFADQIEHLGNNIYIREVDVFSRSEQNNDIEILFTTTQKLHMDLFEVRENSISYSDFERNKIVFISDESHHVNSLTKKPKKSEAEAETTWEYTVTRAFHRNKDNVMLEFTATANLNDEKVKNKYQDKFIFNYPLVRFRESGYTKEFQNFRVDDPNLWTRTLMALVMSEYRAFLFQDLNKKIKPVVLLKSKSISDSQKFYENFLRKMKMLTIEELRNLQATDIKKEHLFQAISYFESKKDGLELLKTSLQNGFREETAVLMNSKSVSREMQLSVNSLEDEDNPIRIIFTVDMLNEGWDVLNLFDIVRLYDTRQSGKNNTKNSYTMKEAQLIGRGARYCPFGLNGDELYRFKRKYDSDLTNRNRILETMYFYSLNDSRYIDELHRALVETGLQAEKPLTLEYTLKETFKQSEFYQKGIVFSNQRMPMPCKRATLRTLETAMKPKVYYYTQMSGQAETSNLFGRKRNAVAATEKKTIVLPFREVEYHILKGAADCFKELTFRVVREKYPHVISMREFLTSRDYLGDSKLNILYTKECVSGRDLFDACKKAMAEVASYMMSLKPEFFGTTEFTPKNLKSILKDKTIHVDKVDINGGKGDSQTYCANENYRLDLSKENWYVFTDNYGTSEEKLFLKYFQLRIAPQLDQKGLEYYVVRNERIPELAIYSFDGGNRFEPDFLLFVKKKNAINEIHWQTYVEPKGSQLLQEDKWKEDFLVKIQDIGRVQGILPGQYKMIGLPFFNHKEGKEKFVQAVEDWLKSMK